MNALTKTVAAEPVRAALDSKVTDLVIIPHITLHTFCETPEVAAAVLQVVSDRRMANANSVAYPGGIAAAIELYAGTVSANLVIIESNAVGAALHERLEGLADVCHSSTKVIIIGHTNDVAVYRDLLIRGINEYIVAPVDPMTLIDAISRIYKGGVAKLGRSLAFVGAKGGVGSSTIAANVASTISRMNGSDVILTDLDLPFGSASLDFNLDPIQGIAQAIGDSGRLDDLLLGRLLTKCDEHLSVLTAPATLAEVYDLEEDSTLRVIELAQSSVPFVVLDVPHIWSSWVKKTLLMADDIVITAVPDLRSLRNAKSLVDLLKRSRPNDPPPRLVLNQVGMPKREEVPHAKFSEALGLELTACIPFQPALFSKAANQGHMIADESKSSAILANFTEIAQAITGTVAAKPTRKGLASLWSW